VSHKICLSFNGCSGVMGLLLYGSRHGSPPMKKYSLVIKEHEEYGGLGIVVDTGRNYFEPGLDGLIVAHDILEHTIKPHSCGFTDELQALGGYIAGRVECAYTSRYRASSIDDVSTDIQSLLTATLNEDGNNNSFTSIEKCNSYLQDQWIMDNLKKNVKEGIIEALDEWSDGEYGEEELADYDIDSIVGWICRGYQMFKKRFSNVTDYGHLFTSIRKVADNFLSDGIEGQTATLCVDFSSCNVFIKGEDGWDY
jgi:hypothetical protein